MYNPEQDKKIRLEHNKRIINKFNKLEPEEFGDNEYYAMLKTEIDKYTEKHIPSIL